MTTATAPAPPAKASLFSRAFGFLQKIGKSLMLPVSVLPVAGILLGVGGAFIGGFQQRAKDLGVCALDGVPTSCDVEKAVGDPVAAGIVAKPVYVFLQILQGSGAPIFAALPLIFAIGVALGLTGNDGVAALAAVVGFAVMVATMGVVRRWWAYEPRTIMGIPSIETGVFGGILIGAVAAMLFNRFYRVQLPPYLGFFAGKRSVPILTAFAAVFAGVVLAWSGRRSAGRINISRTGPPRGTRRSPCSLYGVVERSLIPFGLHHIWNVPFFFEVGQYVDPATGRSSAARSTGSSPGDPTAGHPRRWLPVQDVGPPRRGAGDLAHGATRESRQVGGIMVSAALTSFLTGITEPHRVLVPVRGAAAVRPARVPGGTLPFRSCTCWAAGSATRSPTA